MSKQIVFEVLGMTLAFLGLGVAYFAIYYGIRLDRYKRELQHKERMRALELGRGLPGDEPWSSPSRLAFLIGVVVPVGAFLFAFLASRELGPREEIWMAAGMLGFASVVCGTILALYGPAPRGRRAEQLAGPGAVKPAVEEDAYDVVSSRG